MKLERDRLGKDNARGTWEKRVAEALADQNSEGAAEAFLLSKYDLVPENLANMIQVRAFPTLFKRRSVVACSLLAAPLVKMATAVRRGEGRGGGQATSRGHGLARWRSLMDV